MSTPESPGNGLPDTALLARLANQFFAALPGAFSAPSAGGVPLPANPQPAGLSLPPGTLGPSTPSAVPGGMLPPGANLVPQSPQTAANAGASLPSLLPHAQAPNGVPDHPLMAAPGYDGRAGSLLLGAPVVPPTYYFMTEPSTAAAPTPAAAWPESSSGYYFLEPALREGTAPPKLAPSSHPPFDVNALRRDFPTHQRTPAGLVRQRRHHAEAAMRDRPPGPLLRPRELQHPPRGA